MSIFVMVNPSLIEIFPGAFPTGKGPAAYVCTAAVPHWPRAEKAPGLQGKRGLFRNFILYHNFFRPASGGKKRAAVFLIENSCFWLIYSVDSFIRKPRDRESSSVDTFSAIWTKIAVAPVQMLSAMGASIEKNMRDQAGKCNYNANNKKRPKKNAQQHYYNPHNQKGVAQFSRLLHCHTGPPAMLTILLFFIVS